MDGRRFDRITADLASGATRRRVLAGLGLAATATLVGIRVVAQTDEELLRACLADCHAVAAAGREKCGPRVRKNPDAKAERKTCLKEAMADRKACRKACPRPSEDEPVEPPS